MGQLQLPVSSGFGWQHRQLCSELKDQAQLQKMSIPEVPGLRDEDQLGLGGGQRFVGSCLHLKGPCLLQNPCMSGYSRGKNTIRWLSTKNGLHHLVGSSTGPGYSLLDLDPHAKYLSWLK